MAYVTVGKWGKNLAIRFPLEIAKAAGLNDGEKVEIETRGADILIRRPDAHAIADATAAADEIIEEGRRHSLGEVTFRDLLGDGRRE